MPNPFFFSFFGGGGGYFKQHAKIHHYPGALPPGWVGLALQQGKRDKYSYEAECVTDVPIGCILNRQQKVPKNPTFAGGVFRGRLRFP